MVARQDQDRAKTAEERAWQERRPTAATTASRVSAERLLTSVRGPLQKQVPDACPKTLMCSDAWGDHQCICVSSFEISPFILPKQFCLFSLLLSGRITQEIQGWRPSPSLDCPSREHVVPSPVLVMRPGFRPFNPRPQTSLNRVGAMKFHINSVTLCCRLLVCGLALGVSPSAVQSESLGWRLPDIVRAETETVSTEAPTGCGNQSAGDGDQHTDLQEDDGWKRWDRLQR